MADATDPAVARRERMGAAIRRYRGSRSQSELASALGVSQAGVSLWESGGVDFSYEQILAVEDVLGVAPGTLARTVGYVTAAPTATPFVAVAESVDEAVEMVRAASTLGLHVVAANGFEEQAGRRETWRVVVGDDGVAALSGR